jgi:sec-independent protein translocase protein TatA
MFPSWLQIAVVVLLVVLLFGKGKISDLMGDMARGIKSFKKGMQDDDAVADARDEAPKRKTEAVAGKDETARN